MISIIVAISEDNGIGFGNELLWRIPADMKRFKNLTIGNTVIMGKKTWESLPKRPLPGRTNIVITDNPTDRFEGSLTVYSIEEALKLCKEGSENFIIGGGSIYRQLMPFSDRLYITHIHKKAPSDIYFPEIESLVWEPIETEEHKTGEDQDLPYTYIIYNRVKK
jgi:dihydrofolate reductase